MKTKMLIISTGVLVMVLRLMWFTGPPPVIAASKTELTIAVERLGNQAPLPCLEMPEALDYMKLLYDPLVGTTPDGRLSTTNGVAEKWEMSPDALTWTFYLRKGVKFHDGVELTAKDVKFSIEQVMRPDATMVLAKTTKKLLKHIEVKDPYTLVVNLQKPYPFFATLVSDMEGPDGSMIAPKDYYERVGEDKFLKLPIGSGPYKFQSQMVGSHLKLEALDRHWRDGEPRYKFVTFRIIPEESTRVAMLRTEEADITSISSARLKEVQKAGLNVVSKKDAYIIIFSPNMQWTSPAFSDIRFRKALNFAIDREAIINHIFGGRAEPASTYPGNLISVCGKVPALTPYPYDPKEATRLIKEAGFEGYEFRVPSYKRAGCPEFPMLVETVCAYWEKIGLKPKIYVTDWSTFYEAWASRKTQGIIHGTNASLSPAVESLLTRMRERGHSMEAATLTNDPKLDEMFNRASGSLDPVEVGKILVEAYLYQYNQYHYIPICHTNDELATTKRIPGWDLGKRRKDMNLNDLIRQR